MSGKIPGHEEVAAEQGVRPGRRRRILIGASVAVVLAGLGAAAAYALSAHTTQAAQHGTSAITPTQQGTGQTVAQKQTSAKTTTGQSSTTSGSGHHDGHKAKTTPVGHGNKASTVTTQPATGGIHHAKPPRPVTISDAFAADNINPDTWSKGMDGGDVSVLEQGGKLELIIGAQAVPGGHQNQIDVHVATQCAFPGDFDARVSYRFLEWPPGDNIDVGMNTDSGVAAVMRDNSSQSGDGYTSWVGQSNRPVSFAPMGGSLRIARVDDIETTYYWHGSRWQKLATSRAIGQAVIGLQAVSDGQDAFGGVELKVAFDNFKVTGAKPVCS
jgi:hypothetical protein